ncbi:MULTISPECIES: hypothetical protein [Bacteroides]|uniref:hypothetical protein n=1 Tax=Bacteroides TaxID=816 RepID=UPI0004B9FC05|nr:hypothetical protein [Bacteroides neonati]
MRNRNLQNRITTGRLTLPVVILICITCWLLTGFVLSPSGNEPDTYILWQWFDESGFPQWGTQVISFALYAGIGYFLIEMNNAFGLIRMRASVQTSLYFLLVSVCPALHHFYPGNIAALSLLVSLYFLFKSYQESKPAAHLFHSFAFIGIGSIAFPQLTFFFPIWLIGAYNFQSLTLRSFCAALLGWSLPYWFLFAHAFFYGQMELFYAPFVELCSFRPIELTEQFEQGEIAMLIYLFIQFIVSSVHTIASGFQDKIRTRAYLNFMIFVCLLLFICIFLQPGHSSVLLSVLLPIISILMGHLYALTNNRAANAFFICSMISLILLFIFNVWMLL